jgi:hypothetical protein
LQISNLQRLQRLASSLGSIQSTKAYTMAADIRYAGQQKLKSGEVVIGAWEGEVADVFEGEATGEKGVSESISVAQSAEFAIPNGQQAVCTFAFSTIKLKIEYVATVGELMAATWPSCELAALRARPALLMRCLKTAFGKLVASRC